MIQIARPWL